MSAGIGFGARYRPCTGLSERSMLPILHCPGSLWRKTTSLTDPSVMMPEHCEQDSSDVYTVTSLSTLLYGTGGEGAKMSLVPQPLKIWVRLNTRRTSRASACSTELFRMSL